MLGRASEYFCLKSSMNAQGFGFKITQFRRLDNLKILELTKDIPLDMQPVCPCDGARLRTLCTLAGPKGIQRLRIGCCASCGYVGYIDRPSREWITEFYANTWDNASTMNHDALEKKVRDFRERFGGKVAPRSTTEKMLAKFLPFFKPDLPICEIGCGYGTTLQFLRGLGFRKLTGTEASMHRAEIARRAFNLSIATVSLEDPAFYEQFREAAPLGFIFSHHVLEHVYDPAEIVRTAASFQVTGGYFAFTLPNFLGEFSLSPLFYLPHLHSFTKRSLEVLLGTFGYTLIDASFTTRRELCLLFKKINNKAPPRPDVHGDYDYFDSALKKLQRYFRLPLGPKGNKMLFWGLRNIDIGGRVPYYGPGMARFQEILISRLAPLILRRKIAQELEHHLESKRSSILSFVIEPLTQRYTSYLESPLEVQFEDNIKLYYK